MPKREMTVNQRIDEVLLQRNMTNHELAAKIGKHVTTIDRILDGTTSPHYGTVKAIAEAMNCPIEYLMKGTGPNTNPEVAKDNLSRENDGLHRENEGLWKLVEDFRNGRLTFLNPVKETAPVTGTHG